MRGVTIDACPACGGVWLDENELSAALSTAERLKDLRCHAIQESTVVNCPRCAQPLKKVNFAYDSGVYLHQCSNCSGMFLKNLELNRISEFFDRISSTKQRALIETLPRCSLRHFDMLIEFICSKVVFLTVFMILLVIAATINENSIATAAFITSRTIFPFCCLALGKWLGSQTGISFGFLRPVITEKSSAPAVALAAWFYLVAVFAASLLAIK